MRILRLIGLPFLLFLGFIFIYFLVINILPLPARLLRTVEIFGSMLFITAVGWIINKCINLGEKFLYHYYHLAEQEDIETHSFVTRLIIVKRILNTFVILFTVGAILMLFEPLKELGTSVITSAGIAGIIIGFAAQKSLSNLLLSLQIALSQPIKINDIVVIENEYCQVEEIRSNYVILKAWDARRLVVPINYFIEKPFQNLSRKATSLLGTIMMYVDFKFPVEKMRQELSRIIKHISTWNQQVCQLEVTDWRETSLELRILVSANTPSDLWKLRCEVREKLVEYMRQYDTDTFPMYRYQQLHELHQKKNN